jgi:DNA-3-methyladenine glycosylase I
MTRCRWAETNEIFHAYHDDEWGVPEHDDRRLFEMLNLEGAQAGLSWLTILRKRANYRRAFDRFDAAKIARYSAARRAKLQRDEGIVRNRAKIEAVVANARACLAVKKEFGSFDRFVWGFVDGKPLQGPRNAKAVAASERMSRDLRRRGFRFVGPTICYAFMQATGMVDDHEKGCFRHRARKGRK